jgi:transposase
MQITTIGLDIAKNVFQVHGIDANEKVVVRKQLRRGKLMAFFEALSPCLIGMEAREQWGARCRGARPKIGKRTRQVRSSIESSRQRIQRPQAARQDLGVDACPATATTGFLPCLRRRRRTVPYDQDSWSSSPTVPRCLRLVR